MSKKPKRIRRTFSDEFKQDAVNLVVKQGYSFAAAAKAVDVSSRSLREWHAQLAPKPEACDETSSLEELTAENKRLRKQLERAEMGLSLIHISEPTR